MEHIFGKAWIYIGHESQVKNPGDYFATQSAGGRSSWCATKRARSA